MGESRLDDVAARERHDLFVERIVEAALAIGMVFLLFTVVV
jgi:hypothetical protein